MPCYLRARREVERLQRSTGLSAQVLPSTSQDDGTQPPQYQRIEDVEESGPSTSDYNPLPQIVTVQPQEAEEAAPSASEHPVTETYWLINHRLIQWTKQHLWINLKM